MLFLLKIQFNSVAHHVRFFATPWIAACQASLSITNSRSSLRLTSIESVMPSSLASNHQLGFSSTPCLRQWSNFQWENKNLLRRTLSSYPKSVFPCTSTTHCTIQWRRCLFSYQKLSSPSLFSLYSFTCTPSHLECSSPSAATLTPLSLSHTHTHIQSFSKY